MVRRRELRALTADLAKTAVTFDTTRTLASNFLVEGIDAHYAEVKQSPGPTGVLVESLLYGARIGYGTTIQPAYRDFVGVERAIDINNDGLTDYNVTFTADAVSSPGGIDWTPRLTLKPMAGSTQLTDRVNIVIYHQLANTNYVMSIGADFVPDSSSTQTLVVSLDQFTPAPSNTRTLKPVVTGGHNLVASGTFVTGAFLIEDNTPQPDQMIQISFSLNPTESTTSFEFTRTAATRPSAQIIFPQALQSITVHSTAIEREDGAPLMVLANLGMDATNVSASASIRASSSTYTNDWQITSTIGSLNIDLNILHDRALKFRLNAAEIRPSSLTTGGSFVATQSFNILAQRLDFAQQIGVGECTILDAFHVSVQWTNTNYCATARTAGDTSGTTAASEDATTIDLTGQYGLFIYSAEIATIGKMSAAVKVDGLAGTARAVGQAYDDMSASSWQANTPVNLVDARIRIQSTTPDYLIAFGGEDLPDSYTTIIRHDELTVSGSGDLGKAYAEFAPSGTTVPRDLGSFAYAMTQGRPTGAFNLASTQYFKMRFDPGTFQVNRIGSATDDISFLLDSADAASGRISFGAGTTNLLFASGPSGLSSIDLTADTPTRLQAFNARIGNQLTSVSADGSATSIQTRLSPSEGKLELSASHTLNSFEQWTAPNGRRALPPAQVEHFAYSDDAAQRAMILTTNVQNWNIDRLESGLITSSSPVTFGTVKISNIHQLSSLELKTDHRPANLNVDVQASAINSAGDVGTLSATLVNNTHSVEFKSTGSGDVSLSWIQNPNSWTSHVPTHLGSVEFTQLQFNPATAWRLSVPASTPAFDLTLDNLAQTASLTSSTSAELSDITYQRSVGDHALANALGNHIQWTKADDQTDVSITVDGVSSVMLSSAPGPTPFIQWTGAPSTTGLNVDIRTTNEGEPQQAHHAEFNELPASFALTADILANTVHVSTSSSTPANLKRLAAANDGRWIDLTPILPLSELSATWRGPLGFTVTTDSAASFDLALGKAGTVVPVPNGDYTNFQIDADLGVGGGRFLSVESLNIGVDEFTIDFDACGRVAGTFAIESTTFLLDAQDVCLLAIRTPSATTIEVETGNSLRDFSYQRLTSIVHEFVEASTINAGQHTVALDSDSLGISSPGMTGAKLVIIPPELTNPGEYRQLADHGIWVEFARNIARINVDSLTTINITLEANDTVAWSAGTKPSDDVFVLKLIGDAEGNEVKLASFKPTGAPSGFLGSPGASTLLRPGFNPWTTRFLNADDVTYEATSATEHVGFLSQGSNPELILSLPTSVTFRSTGPIPNVKISANGAGYQTQVEAAGVLDELTLSTPVDFTTGAFTSPFDFLDAGISSGGRMILAGQNGVSATQGVGYRVVSDGPASWSIAPNSLDAQFTATSATGIRSVELVGSQHSVRIVDNANTGPAYNTNLRYDPADGKLEFSAGQSSGQLDITYNRGNNWMTVLQDSTVATLTPSISLWPIGTRLATGLDKAEVLRVTNLPGATIEGASGGDGFLIISENEDMHLACSDAACATGQLSGSEAKLLRVGYNVGVSTIHMQPIDADSLIVDARKQSIQANLANTNFAQWDITDESARANFTQTISPMTQLLASSATSDFTWTQAPTGGETSVTLVDTPVEGGAPRFESTTTGPGHESEVTAGSQRRDSTGATVVTGNAAPIHTVVVDTTGRTLSITGGSNANEVQVWGNDGSTNMDFNAASGADEISVTFGRETCSDARQPSFVLTTSNWLTWVRASVGSAGNRLVLPNGAAEGAATKCIGDEFWTTVGIVKSSDVIIRAEPCVGVLLENFVVASDATFLLILPDESATLAIQIAATNLLAAKVGLSCQENGVNIDYEAVPIAPNSSIESLHVAYEHLSATVQSNPLLGHIPCAKFKTDDDQCIQIVDIYGVAPPLNMSIKTGNVVEIGSRFDGAAVEEVSVRIRAPPIINEGFTPVDRKIKADVRVGRLTAVLERGTLPPNTINGTHIIMSSVDRIDVTDSSLSIRLDGIETLELKIPTSAGLSLEGEIVLTQPSGNVRVRVDDSNAGRDGTHPHLCSSIRGGLSSITSITDLTFDLVKPDACSAPRDCDSDPFQLVLNGIVDGSTPTLDLSGATHRSTAYTDRPPRGCERSWTTRIKVEPGAVNLFVDLIKPGVARFVARADGANVLFTATDNDAGSVLSINAVGLPPYAELSWNLRSLIKNYFSCDTENRAIERISFFKGSEGGTGLRLNGPLGCDEFLVNLAHVAGVAAAATLLTPAAASAAVGMWLWSSFCTGTDWNPLTDPVNVHFDVRGRTVTPPGPIPFGACAT